MPRSPLAQSPAGRLCSTCFKPLPFSRAATSSLGKSYGKRYSTPRKARLGGGLEAIEEVALGEQHRKIGGIFRHGVRPPLVQQRGDRGRRVGVACGKVLEFDDVVDFGSHRDVGDALEDDLDHDRHAEFLHQSLRLREGVLDFVRGRDADRLAAEPFGDLDVIDAIAAPAPGALMFSKAS